MTRVEIQDSFVEQFASGMVLPSDPAALEQDEAELKILFPQSFLEFATRFGALHTPEIEDLFAGGASGFDVQEFFSAHDILKTTQAYRDGLVSDTFVVVAVDCMGNVFGFQARAGAGRSDDAAVYVFDHRSGKTAAVAQSFDAWLLAFLDMKKQKQAL